MLTPTDDLQRKRREFCDIESLQRRRVFKDEAKRLQQLLDTLPCAPTQLPNMQEQKFANWTPEWQQQQNDLMSFARGAAFASRQNLNREKCIEKETTRRERIASMQLETFRSLQHQLFAPLHLRARILCAVPRREYRERLSIAADEAALFFEMFSQHREVEAREWRRRSAEFRLDAAFVRTNDACAAAAATLRTLAESDRLPAAERGDRRDLATAAAMRQNSLKRKSDACVAFMERFPSMVETLNIDESALRTKIAADAESSFFFFVEDEWMRAMDRLQVIESETHERVHKIAWEEDFAFDVALRDYEISDRVRTKSRKLDRLVFGDEHATQRDPARVKEYLAPVRDQISRVEVEMIVANAQWR